jgi:hypothetical protein
MRIDQRNNGAAVTNGGVYLVDRFESSISTDGAFTIQQVSEAPTGFVNSLKFTTTTADASLGDGQYTSIRQKIEGLNVADLAWGTASASPITLSFWVRSSLTGTFGGVLKNSAQNRSYTYTYTILVANTWEQKSITIAGDTTGTWLTNNGAGITVAFSLGTGATFSSTAGAWAAGNFVSATGSQSVVGTNGATFYITGVQLERGTQATSFEYRQYGQELALCQRYYQRYPYVGIDGYGAGAGGTFAVSSSFWWTVQMRTAPTVTFGTAAFVSNTSASVPDINVIAPTASYLLAQINPSAAGRTYMYIPVFATAEL